MIGFSSCVIASFLFFLNAPTFLVLFFSSLCLVSIIEEIRHTKNSSPAVASLFYWAVLTPFFILMELNPTVTILCLAVLTYNMYRYHQQEIKEFISRFMKP